MTFIRANLELIISTMASLLVRHSTLSSLRAVGIVLLSAFLMSACSDDKPSSKFIPIPDKKQAETTQEEDLLNRRVESVLNEGLESKEGIAEAPRASKARPPNSGKEPMMMLDKNKIPLGEIVYHSDKLDYYECKGIVAPWFLELVVAEMNYFNELAELQFVDPKTCIVTYGTEKSKQFDRCIRSEECPIFRTLNLVPNRNALFRSYFLSDNNRKLIQHQCVTDTGKWHRDETCYTVE